MQFFDGFDEFMAETMAAWDIPGMAVAVVKDGEVVHQQGYGLRDVDAELPVDEHTVFAIGSSSKAFTATTIGMLVDDGLLDWNKPIREYMPDFQLKDPFATERMTAIDLLCHRSGLPRHDLMWYSSPHGRKEIFDRLRYLEPSKDFRTFLQYQNLMFMTAGYLVEVLTGQTWEEFVAARIFAPLGMTSSNSSVLDTQKGDNYALPHVKPEDEACKKIPFRNIDNVAPAGSINSNAVDMAKWLQFNLAEGKWGEEQLIAAETLAEIHTPQMPFVTAARMFPFIDEHPELGHTSYGMGWFIHNYRGSKAIHHGGAIDGFIAQVAMLPQENLGVVCLSNMGGKHAPVAVAFNVFDRFLEKEPIDWNTIIQEYTAEALGKAKAHEEQIYAAKHPDTTPSHDLAAYVGEYTHPAYGTLLVEAHDDQLTCHYNTLDLIAEHLHYDQFLLRNDLSPLPIPASFITGLLGAIEKLEVQLEPAVAPIVFLKEQPEPEAANDTAEAEDA